MSSKNATSRPRYTIHDDGLILHERFFARCGDGCKIYILPESGKRGSTYLGLQQFGSKYWNIVELLTDDCNRVYNGIHSSSVEETKFAGLSQAAKYLISIFKQEEEWYESIFG